jgi:hypothetical protein
MTFKDYLNEAKLAHNVFLDLVSQEFAAYKDHQFRENCSEEWSLSKNDFNQALKEFTLRLGEPTTEKADILTAYNWKGPDDWYIELWEYDDGRHELHIWTKDFIEQEKQSDGVFEAKYYLAKDDWQEDIDENGSSIGVCPKCRGEARYETDHHPRGGMWSHWVCQNEQCGYEQR